MDNTHVPTTTLDMCPVDEIHLYSPEYFTDTSVVSAAVLANLSADRIEQFTAAQTAVLVASQLAELDEPRVQKLSHVGSLTVVSNTFPLTDTQVGYLIGSQVAVLTSAQIKSLNSARIKAINLTSLPSLSKDQMGMFNPEQMPMFNTEQVAAFKHGASNTTQQIQGLSVDQIKALTSTDDANQVGALTADQIHAFSDAQVKAFTKTQIPKLHVEHLYATAVSGATGHSNQLSLLLSDQIESLLETQIQSLSLQEQVQALTEAQIKSFDDSQIPYFTESQVAFFLEAQIKALTDTQIPALTYAEGVNQIANFTTTQMGYFKPTQMALMTPNQVAHFLPEQIAVFTDLQTAAFTKAQLDLIEDPDAINAFKHNKFNSVRSYPLNPDQLSKVLPANIEDIQVDHIYKWSPAADYISALSTDQMKGFTPTQMKHFSDAAIAAISPAQVLAWEPASSGDHCLLADLFVSQFAAFNSDARSAIQGSDKLVPPLSEFQSSALDKSSGFYTQFQMTPVRNITNQNALTHLTPLQMTYLTRGQILSLKNLTNYQTQISRDAIASLNANVLGMDSAAGIVVTLDYPPTYQLALINPNDISYGTAYTTLGNSFTAAQLNAFSAGQFSAFNSKLIATTVINALDGYLSQITLAKLSNMTSTQVINFKPAQLLIMKNLFAAESNMSYETASKFQPYQLAGARDVDTPSYWVAAADWADSTPTGLQPISWFTTVIIDFLKTLIASNSKLNFELSALNVSNVSTPSLETISENTLGIYDNVIKFEITETEAKCFITYRKLANDVLAFYTDISKFNIKGKKTGSTKKSIGAFDFSQSNVLGQDGTTDLNHSMAFNFTRYQVEEKYGVASVDLIKNPATKISELNAAINTKANQTIYNALSKLDCNNPTDTTGLTKDENELWSSSLNGYNQDDLTISVPTAIYNAIASKVGSRLETNVATNGVYNMPITVGDTFRFLISLAGVGAFSSVAKTYLVIIEVVA
jgi:hypothetical protein